MGEYSSRKPYNAFGGMIPFFTAPSRHLMESNAMESSFEKPYNVANYNLMHQEPNLPAIPDDPGPGGPITISFVDGACGYGIHAYAGNEILTIGGPEEDKAGWLEPVVAKGAIVSWKVSGPGLRRMDIVLDETLPIHNIKVTFIDGWGHLHTEQAAINCLSTGIFVGWPNTITVTIGNDWSATPTEALFVPGNVISLVLYNSVEATPYKIGDTYYSYARRDYSEDGTATASATNRLAIIEAVVGYVRGTLIERIPFWFAYDEGGGIYSWRNFYFQKSASASGEFYFKELWTGNSYDTSYFNPGIIDFTIPPPNDYNPGIFSAIS